MNKKNTMDFNYIITPPIKKAENIINQALTLPNATLYIRNEDGNRLRIKPNCKLIYIQYEEIDNEILQSR